MTHQPSLDQDLRTALHKAVSNALHDNQFADSWPEMVDPVVDAVLALTPAQAPDKAGERDGVEDDARDAQYKAEQAEEAECDALFRAETAEAEITRLQAIIAALAPQPNGTEASRGLGAEDEAEKYAEESYQLGKRDGYEEGVQAVAWAVGLDGEYRCSPDPDRHVPDPATMIERIAEHFHAAAPTPPLSPDSTGSAGASDGAKLLAKLQDMNCAWMHHSIGSGCEVVGWKINRTDGFKGLSFMQDVEWALAALTPSAPIAAPAQDDENEWREDPSADERWNAGLDYGMTQLCAVLKVDTDTVNWDAATETLGGDVRSVMRGILTLWGGDEWQDLPAPAGDVPGEAQTGSGDDEPDDLKWLRYQVLALCEDTEEKYAKISQEDLEEKQGAFARGRVTEAKSIRRAIAEVVRCRLAARSSGEAQTQEGGR